jgi:hypothetical protein
MIVARYFYRLRYASPKGGMKTAWGKPTIALIILMVNKSVCCYLRGLVLVCILSLGVERGLGQTSNFDEQAKALLSQMTLDEKIGQMTQTDFDALKDKADVQKYYLGSVLSGGGHAPKEIDAKGWLKACDEFRHGR